MNDKVIAFVLIIKSIILLLIVMNSFSITGGAVIGDGEISASAPADKVHEFFGIQRVVFPEYGCGDIARGLYENIAYKSANEMVGFATNGPTRAATINFVLDRIRQYGTIDMIKGKSLIGGFEDSMISINTEAIVRTPKANRNTFFNMDLYGITNQNFYVQKGRFSTPSLDCTFTNQDGQAICDCKVHSIRDIAVAGIPNPLRVELENPPSILRNLK